MKDVFMGDFYEPPYYPECPECGSTLFEPECPVCAEADAGEYWDDAA